MTRDEIVEKLQTLARMSRDAACAHESGVLRHQPEFDELIDLPTDKKTQRTQDRLLELYPIINGWKHEAKRLHDEATLFDMAALLIFTAYERPKEPS